jgi:hypothetical protein
VITVYGKPSIVVISAEEYARLIHLRCGKLSAALLYPEITGEDLDLARSPDTDGIPVL